MNDTHEQNVAGQGVTETSTLISMGAVLKSAREAKQLDIEDICSYLRLSRRQVVALESDDFAALPEATITRGFIRNYARMLELDAEPLLAAYRNLSASEEPRPISIQSENIRIPGNDKSPWLLYAVASVLIVLLVTAWVIYVDYIPKTVTETAYVPSETEQEAAAGSSDAQLPQLADPLTPPTEPVGGEQVAPVDGAAGSEGALTAPVAETQGPAGSAAASAAGEAASAPAAASIAAATAGMVVVRLQATERSWVSITDRNNKNIFDKIMVAGIEETVQGEPPLQVVIGNAPSTKLTFNNQTIDLAPVTHDRVARLTLE